MKTAPVSSDPRVSSASLDSSVTSMRCLLARPNWRVGWFLWLRAVLPMAGVSVAVTYLSKLVVRTAGIPMSPAALTKVSEIQSLALLGMTVTLVHFAIRRWAHQQYRLTLPGWVWWSFLWRLTLIQLMTWALACAIALAVGFGVLAVATITNRVSPNGIYAMAGGIGLALLWGVVANIPAYGWVAHKAIAAYNVPRRPRQWPRALVRIIGCLMIAIGIAILGIVVRDHLTPLSLPPKALLRLVLGVAALGAGVGLLRLRSWARQIGIVLMAYVLVRTCYNYLRAGEPLTQAHWIVLGVFGSIPIALLLPVVKQLFLRNNGKTPPVASAVPAD